MPGAQSPAPGQGMNIRQALATADKLRAAGRLQEADSLCGQILAGNPVQPDALFLRGLVAISARHPERGADLIRQAITINGRNPDYHANLGAALMMLERKAEGTAALERALALDPKHPRANYNLGLARMFEKNMEAAEGHLKQAIKAQPGNSEASVSLAVVLTHQGKFDKATSLLRGVLRKHPRHEHALLNLGNAYYEQDLYDAAIKTYQQLIEVAPRSARGHYHLGLAYSKVDKVEAAIEHYRQSIALNPKAFEPHNNLASLLQHVGERQEALDHLRTASRLNPGVAEIQYNIANALGGMDRNEEAIEAFRAIESEDPLVIERCHGGIVIALHQLGRFDEARKTVAALRSRLPDSVAPIMLKAIDGSTRLEPEEIARAKAYVDRQAEDHDDLIWTNLCFALGNEFARAEAYDEAFHYFARGNRARDREHLYESEKDHAKLRAVIETFTPDLFKQLAEFGKPSRRPIFIVGMPRSGTTLTEQILASHPDVAGAGELSALGKIALGMSEAIGSATPYPQCMGALTREDAQSMAGQYLTALAECDPEALRVTDKMPDNFAFLGLIAVLFPNARIIHCRRDPRDTCLSIFCQSFRGFHPYFYDLGKLAEYYRLYGQWMAHWRAVLPLPILEIDYEDTVADQEGVSRRLLEFCGLDWDEAVLAFHETERAVKTASVWQVRQPIYSRSVGRWRSYERHLEPLLEGLRDLPV